MSSPVTATAPATATAPKLRWAYIDHWRIDTPQGQLSQYTSVKRFCNQDDLEIALRRVLTLVETGAEK